MSVPPAAVVGDRYRTLDVAVRGGTLHAAVWEPVGGASAPATVVAVHGITSSHLAWSWLAALLPDVRLVAPDLRGRGRSRDLPGPYGMPTHAEDVAAVMDAVGVQDAVVVGHSMGAFVALVLADRHPERVRSLVLVDGGMPLDPPPGVSAEQMSHLVLGPAAERLRMTFPDRAAYRRFWRDHPAFAAVWDRGVEAYVDYDLCGHEPGLRPATTVAALEEDIRELVDGDSLLTALRRLRHDTTWLVAPRGLLDEVPPLYPSAAREKWTAEHPGVRLAEVPDVNHYTIVMSDAGARAVEPVLREALAR